MMTKENVWQQIKQHQEPWDLIVIGGGITGAGIMREAVRAGMRVLLVERRDFSWGTSSRSSKLVHGGMRYLKQGNFKLTRESVLERDRLLAESQNLVRPLPFLATAYEGQKPGKLTFAAGITIYNLISGRWQRMNYSPDETGLIAPYLEQDHLQGTLGYLDARADDCRMVLRLIFEGIAHGGTAIHRVSAQKPKLEGSLWQVPLQFGEDSHTAACRVVVNATGVWVNRLRQEGEAPIRPLRGSHLVFPQWRLPSPRALAIVHPRDGRPVYVLPWEGATVFGTTDKDHAANPDDEACMTSEEAAYLMEALHAAFPSLNLSLADAVSSYAGVRPVISTGKKDPSKESRDHKIWDEQGQLSITGGKLTTFRTMALDLLSRAKAYLPELVLQEKEAIFDDEEPVWGNLTQPAPEICDRLRGRFGSRAPDVWAMADFDEGGFVPGTETLWVELRWAARMEMVSSLDDLLLRRVRVGLLLPEGAREIFAKVEQICREELGWDEVRFARERDAYFDVIHRFYRVPDGECAS